jgi:hypothetical protein
MTEPTDAIEHRALVAQLTSLVADLRALRERMAQPGVAPPTFVALTDTIAGLNPQPVLRSYLKELGSILDAHSAEEVDADLDTRWRAAMSRAG